MWAASRFQLWVFCSPRAAFCEAAAGSLTVCKDKVLLSQLVLAGLIKRKRSRWSSLAWPPVP